MTGIGSVIRSSELLEEWYMLDLDTLEEKARETCCHSFGKSVYLRGLIEFSSFCAMDCHYCGIRKSNTATGRYRMEEEEIFSVIREGFKRGFRTFVLQSGEDPEYPVARLCRLLEGVRKIVGDAAALTLSCGIFTKKQYSELKRAGCDRYLMRFETSDEALYKKLRNGLSLADRVRALGYLKELGFETGSGFLTGLPGETETTRLNNIRLCRELELDMVGIGPFIPHSGTPLGQASIQPIELALRCVALVRLLLPGANMPATTAAGTLEKDGRGMMLAAGANVIMPNITPVVYRKNYLLYPGKICVAEPELDSIESLNRMVVKYDREIDWSRGNSLYAGNSNVSFDKKLLRH